MHLNSRRLRLMARLIADNRRYFIGAAVCALISVIVDYTTPLLLAETLDHYLSDKPSQLPAFIDRWIGAIGGPAFMRSHLWIVGLMLVGLSALGGACNFAKGRWQSMAGENAARDLRRRLYDHIQRLPFSYHVKAETGDLVQRCTSDVDTVRRFLINQLMAVFSSLLMIVVALTVLFRRNARPVPVRLPVLQMGRQGLQGIGRGRGRHERRIAGKPDRRARGARLRPGAARGGEV